MAHRHSGSLILIMALAAAWTICIPAADAQKPAADLPSARGVDRAPAPPDERLPKRIAICIGIDGYSCQGYAPLHCAVSDAEALANAFATLGYETHLLTDNVANPSQRPTYENLNRELRHVIFSATEEEDTLVITFSGHGDAIGGMPVLLPLDYGTEHAPLSVNHLLDAELLGSPFCRARKKLLIIDACHSAGSGLAQLISGIRVESCVLLSGCGERQLSIEDEKLGHGHLTQAILDGLSGKGYGKDEKFLFVEDLEKYIRRRFEEEKWSPMQNPEFRGRIAGTFDLAVRDLPRLPRLSNYDRKMLARALEDALEAWKEKNYTDAVDAATHALRIDEKNADALAERALAYLSLGYRDRALADAAEARDLDANQLLAMEVRGVALIEVQKDPAAQREGLALLKSVEAAIDASPGRWPFLASGKLAAGRLGLIGYGLALLDHEYPAAVDSFTRAIEMKDTRPGQVATLLLFRGAMFDAQSQFEKAAADYTRVIEMKDASAEQAASALVNRAIAYEKLGHLEQEVADCTRVIEMKIAGADQLVGWALVNRSFAYEKLGQPEKVVADCTRVIEMKDASPGQVAMALVNRGAEYGNQGHAQKEVADCTRVIEMKDAPVRQMAMALVNRGFAYGKLGQPEKQMADYTRAAELKDAPAEPVARALFNRAFAYEMLGQRQKAVADYTCVLGMKDVSATDAACALVGRAVLYQRLSQPEKAVADCNRVIDMKNAPSAFLAKALVNRGFVYGQMGHPQWQLADASQVIGMKGVPQDINIEALLCRADAYHHLRDWPASLENCEQVLQVKTITPQVRAVALAARGAEFYHLGALDKALADSRAALAIDPKLSFAAFDIGLILLRGRHFDDARASFADSLARGAPPVDAVDILVELRDKLDGPPETDVVLALFRIKTGKAREARDDLQRYLNGHRDGPFAGWAQALLVESATSK